MDGIAPAQAAGRKRIGALDHRSLAPAHLAQLRGQANAGRALGRRSLALAALGLGTAEGTYAVAARVLGLLDRFRGLLAVSELFERATGQVIVAEFIKLLRGRL